MKSPGIAVSDCKHDLTARLPVCLDAADCRLDAINGAIGQCFTIPSQSGATITGSGPAPGNRPATMSQKTRIVDTLGEQSLLRPTVINAALAANDRAKYYFTLLQTAVLRAQRPDSRAPDLRRERLACGVDNEVLDMMPPGVRTRRVA